MKETKDIKQRIEEFPFNEEYGRERGSMGDLMEIVLDIKTKEDAARILERYREFNPKFADQNLGYFFGYCDEETRKRLYGLFPVSHPVFGSGFGRGKDPTPEEAFYKGRKIIKSK